MNAYSQLKGITPLYHFILFCFFFAGRVQFLTAQDFTTWQPTSGPPGGSVYSFARLSDNVLVAGTNRGVYLSQDNGINWIPRSEGYIADQVRALMVTPTGAIVAGTNEGLYRSTDAGISWARLESGLDSPSFTAFTAGGGNLFAGGPMGVLRSIDNGDTWQLTNEGLRETSISSLEYTQEGDVLAGTEEGIFQWIELSNDWRETSNGLNKISDRIIYSIKRYDDRRLLAGTASGIFISDADFIEWNPLIGLLDDDREALVIDLAINDAGVIYAATPNLVYRSEDEGINWEPLSRGLPPIAPELQSLNRLHLDENDDLLAGTIYYGVYRYAASIKQWEPSTSGLSTLSVFAIMLNTFGDVLAGTRTGLFTSSDRGSTWNQPIMLENLDGFELIHQDFQGRIFANGSSLIFSEDEGVNWTPLLAERVDALIVLADNTFLAQSQNSNSILRSSSEGEAWTSVGNIPFQTANAVVHGFTQDNQARIWAGTDEGMFRSSDRGVTWESVSTGSTTISSAHSLTKDTIGRIYVGADNGLYRSDEPGDLFELILEMDSGIREVRVLEENNLLVITNEDDILRSMDGAITWTPINEGLPEGAILLSLIVDDRTIADDMGAYISIQGGGIYRRNSVIQLSNESSRPFEEFDITSFPNPFSNALTVSFDLKHPDHLRIEIFDVLGRTVQTLYDAPVQPGRHAINWDTSGLPMGTYFIQLTQKGERVVRSVIKAR